MKRFIAVMIGVVAAIVWTGCENPSLQGPILQGPPAEVGPAKMIFDFEDAAIWKSENDSPFQAVAQHVTQGRKALKVHYTNKPDWSNIYTQTVPANWGNLRYLTVDIFLEGDVPAEFGMWIRDAGHHKAESTFLLGPGANTITIDLDELKTKYELDRTHVSAVCLYKTCPQEITVYLDNMYASEKAPSSPKAEPVRMADKELLTNGSFEDLQAPDELGNPFRWWQARRWEGQSFIGSGSKAVFSGKHSAMLDGRGPCKIGFFSPMVKVQCPTRLKLTAMLAANDLKKGLWNVTGSITVTDAGERGLKGASINWPEGTYGWKKVEIVFDVPDKCPYVKVFIQQSGIGRAWVDDISLTGVDLDAKLGATLADAGKTAEFDGPLVTESPALLAKRAQAEKAIKDLRDAVAAAKAKGVETLYDEIPLVLGDLGLSARWNLPKHLKLREGNCDYVVARCQASIAHLKDVMDGKAPDLKVPPHPDLAKLKLNGRYFCEGDEPKILFSMQYHSKGELVKWFYPGSYAGHVPAVGASRYDVQSTPVWEAYQKDPDTHRVYDNGWCGHIICDQYSLGGSSKPCVISLDSPVMREAIAKSIANYAAKVPKTSLFANIGFEYSYVNYDKFSAEGFRGFLAKKYGKVDALNAIWKTAFTDFAEVTLPSYDPAKPETNPAKYYDFGEFNLWRFTDYMKWAKAEIRKHLPGLLATTGGGEPFGASFWRQGIDEEGLAREGVNDIFLSETGSRALGVTSTMDLQRSLLGKPTPILDPEYHALPNTCFLMFLHGCSVMDYWWWPETEGEFDDSSMKHSDKLSLEEVGVVMRTALDVRRLAKQIAAFPDAPAQVGLLYSRASLIQKYPKAQGHKTPYTLETEKTYEAAAGLDTPVGFVSSRMVREGIPASYKMLIVPGCRYVEEDVFAKLRDWVKAGGTLIITPTSLVADEYNRKRDYLASLGLEVVSEELPEYLAGEAKPGTQQTGEMDFIQGPVVKTIVSKEPKRRVVINLPEGPASSIVAEASGVIQTIKCSKEWEIVGSYEKGGPAVAVRTYKGFKGEEGRIVYLAAQLDVASRRRLIDGFMNPDKFDRPIRMTADDGVEMRAVRSGRDFLVYVANTTGKVAAAKLMAFPLLNVFDGSTRKLTVYDLTTERPGEADMKLAPYETRILRVKTDN